MISAEEIIKRFELVPLKGEGGFYRQTYIASETIPRSALPARYRGDKPFGTAIYYLLTPETCSRLHRLPTDEVYHFYLGDPVELLLLLPGGGAHVLTLGHRLDAGQQVQAVVPRGAWQGSYLLPGGAWALMGTTMAPGFDPSDFEAGDRETLAAQYPKQADRIARLTPPFDTR